MMGKAFKTMHRVLVLLLNRVPKWNLNKFYMYLHSSEKKLCTWFLNSDLKTALIIYKIVHIVAR